MIVSSNQLMGILIISLFIISCWNTPQQKDGNHVNRVSSLIEKQKRTECRLSELKDSIDRTWDEINEMMVKNLPDLIGAEEAESIVKVRNAEHLRMFQSYDKLDSSIIDVIDQAEIADKRFAQSIKDLKFDLSNIGDSITQILIVAPENQRYQIEKMIKDYRNQKITNKCK
ncbi:MAG: hypothetical protein R2784_03750 [Saprospiraceae bacterium]